MIKELFVNKYEFSKTDGFWSDYPTLPNNDRTRTVILHSIFIRKAKLYLLSVFVCLWVLVLVLVWRIKCWKTEVRAIVGCGASGSSRGFHNKKLASKNRSYDVASCFRALCSQFCAVKMWWMIRRKVRKSAGKCGISGFSSTHDVVAILTDITRSKVCVVITLLLLLSSSAGEKVSFSFFYYCILLVFVLCLN